jgi:Mn-dependent DtxR family transcriptional regulator
MERFSGLRLSGEASRLLAVIGDLGGKSTPVPIGLLADYVSLSEQSVLEALREMNQSNIVKLDEALHSVSLTRE